MSQYAVSILYWISVCSYVFISDYLIHVNLQFYTILLTMVAHCLS